MTKVKKTKQQKWIKGNSDIIARRKYNESEVKLNYLPVSEIQDHLKPKDIIVGPLPEKLKRDYAFSQMQHKDISILKEPTWFEKVVNFFKA